MRQPATPMGMASLQEMIAAIFATFAFKVEVVDIGGRLYGDLTDLVRYTATRDKVVKLMSVDFGPRAQKAVSHILEHPDFTALPGSPPKAERNTAQTLGTLRRAAVGITRSLLAPESARRRAMTAVEEIRSSSEAIPSRCPRSSASRTSRPTSPRLPPMSGVREAGKFSGLYVIRRNRKQLLLVGTELCERGLLDRPDDIFFLDLAQARAAVSAAVDHRPLVAARRAVHDREMRRRHVPVALLSDGTDIDATMQAQDPTGTELTGVAASPGTATGPARVILDPKQARVEPGEILVVPTTDPGPARSARAGASRCWAFHPGVCEFGLDAGSDRWDVVLQGPAHDVGVNEQVAVCDAVAHPHMSGHASPNS